MTVWFNHIYVAIDRTIHDPLLVVQHDSAVMITCTASYPFSKREFRNRERRRNELLIVNLLAMKACLHHVCLHILIRC